MRAPLSPGMHRTARHQSTLLVRDHATGQVTTMGHAGEHEALTGDDRVDERRYSVEHQIMRGQTSRCVKKCSMNCSVTR